MKKQFITEAVRMQKLAGILKENINLEELPLTSEIKQEVDNTIAKAIEDGEMEYLQQAGYWENDFEENLLMTFEDEFPNAYEISDTLHNYIQDKVYGGDKLDKNQNINSFEQLLDSIPKQKYFYIADLEYDTFFGPEADHSPVYDYSRFDAEEDGDLVDYFYDDIFNNELKGKPGVKGNNFNEFQSIDDEENDGENVKLLYDKITQIITDFKRYNYMGRKSAPKINENTMDNFNLKKFLVENKLTANSRIQESEEIKETIKEAFDTEFRDIRDMAYRDAERAIDNTDDSVINSDYYGHYVKEYLRAYESLTSQLIYQQNQQ